MDFPRIYIDEPLPTGYSGSVKVLANLTTKELTAWYAAHLGIPGCEECAKLRTRPADVPDTQLAYCEPCTAARAAFGASIGLIYGPKLLGEDVSTPEQALAVFDRDDWPAELVSWLFVLPDSVRLRRTETIRKNARSSSGLIDNS